MPPIGERHSDCCLWEKCCVQDWRPVRKNSSGSSLRRNRVRELPCVCLCEPLCALLRGKARTCPIQRFGAPLGGISRLCGGRNRVPAEAQRSGFGGRRNRSVMSEFSPFSAEMRGMELAVTRSRIKGWRRNRRSARSLLPAVRAVGGGFSAGGCGVYSEDFLHDWRLTSVKSR